MRMTLANYFRLAAVILLVTGCASREPLNSWFDTDTALTYAAMHEPLVVARPVNRVTVAGRDYAYLGPIDINRMGRRDHYLWIGMASTVDRALLDEAQPQAVNLVLIVDDVPMDFPLRPWNPGLEALPYPVSTPVYESFVARASLDQIDRIAAAESVSVQFALHDGRAASYDLWSGSWIDWSGFIERAEDQQPVRQARRE